MTDVRNAHRKNQGFTLIELLVTLVLLGMILSLTAAAMGQVSQILRVSNELDKGFLPRWRQARLLTELVENTALDPNRLQPFIGNDEQFIFDTMLSPWASPGTIQRLKIKFMTDSSDTQQTKLLVNIDSSILPQRVSSGGVDLMSFDSPVAFKYRDSSGQEHNLWPPQSGSIKETLPTAILIKQKSGRQLLMKQIVFPGEVKIPLSVSDQFLGIR